MGTKPNGNGGEIVVAAAVVKKYEDRVLKFLPETIDRQRWMDLAVSAVRDPQIAECDPMTVLVSVSNAARMNLAIGDGRGHAYLVAYRKRNRQGAVMGSTCSLIVGYKGFIELAMRHPRVTSVDADYVCENDSFAFDRGRGFIEHSWDLRHDRGELVGAWAKATLAGASTPIFVVVNRDECEAIAANSRGFGWVDHKSSMYRKTAVRRLSSILPQTVELGLAMKVDPEGAPSPSIDTTAEEVERPERSGRSGLREALAIEAAEDDEKSKEPEVVDESPRGYHAITDDDVEAALG